MTEPEENIVVLSKIADEDILKSYFEKNNLSFLIEEFKAQKVFSPEIIKDLTDNDLEKLGVTTLGDRKRILKLFSSNDFENYKTELMYKDLSPEEREKLDIPENKVLKQNSFRYGGGSVFAEEGKLTLFENRITWKGTVNDFIIPINKIIDVSIKNGSGFSELIITDDKKEHKFYTVNRVSGALTGAGIASNNLLYLGLAAMNDKPMSDIEFWRVLIEKLRERNPSYHGGRGQDIKDSSGDGCLATFIVGIIAAFILFFVWMMSLY